MVENQNNIYLFNDYYTFVHKKRDKLVFKSVNSELIQIKILEIEFNKDKTLKKVDIYTVVNEELIDSTHITKGVDGIIELDFYPIKQEYIMIDGKRELYKLNIYATYNELLESNNKTLEVELVKKGHRRHKILNKIFEYNTLYISKNKNKHRIISKNIKNVEEMINVIGPSLNQIEEKYQEETFTPYQITQEQIETVISEYPLSIFVYDRNYDLVGIKDNILIYRNNEDGIQELEIILNIKEEKVTEVKFINYIQNEIEGIKNTFKSKVIRMQKIEDNIYASLNTFQKESVNINDKAKQDVSIKVQAIVDKEGYINSMNLNLETEEEKLELNRSNTFGVDYNDRNNNEYRTSSRSYNGFKSMLTYSRGIFNSIEKKMFGSKEKNKSLIINNITN